MLKLVPINAPPKLPRAIIWTCKSEKDSALPLSKELEIPCLTHLDHPIDYYDEHGIIILRWGQSATHHYKDFTRGDFANVINCSAAGRLNVQKPLALKAISKVTLTPKLYEKIIPKGKLAVHRPTTHSKGRDFQVIKGFHRIGFGSYATQLIPNKKEWRIWFCNGKVMGATRVTQNKKRLAEKYPVKSLWNYKFYKRIPKGAIENTLKAAKAIGLDFGAADIIEHRNKFYVLENNTAPALDQEPIEKFYKKELKQIIKKFKVVKLIRKYAPAPIVRPLWTINTKGEMVWKQKAAAIKPIGNTKPIGAIKSINNHKAVREGWWARFKGNLETLIP